MLLSEPFCALGVCLSPVVFQFVDRVEAPREMSEQFPGSEKASAFFGRCMIRV